MADTTTRTTPNLEPRTPNSDLPNMPGVGEGSVESDHFLESGDREMVLNLGPQHPSTHGVLRVVVRLDGEIIRACDLVIGYLHRGTEKLGENARYVQFTPWTDRTDYIAAPSNNLGYIMALEKLLGIEDRIPERAQYFRVILAELTRIASHLVGIGTHAMDIGALSMSLYTFREREMILDLFENYCGARLTTNIMEVGGFQRVIPDSFWEMLREFLRVMPERLSEYEKLLNANPIWIGRTKGIGYISREDALSFGLTGPLLRAAGVNYDVRKAMPYLVYDRMDFEVPLGENSDTYDRYLVRMEEMRQSLRIIEQAMTQMPTDGPLMADEPRYVFPPHDAVMFEAEAMQRHFKLVIEGFSPPPGEVYVGIENPKGELGYYIVSDGTPHAYRLRIRPPSMINLQIVNKISVGTMIADLIAILGTIDMVLGEVDR
jgi:NADH-quinone oxidoreductase subunit D